MTKEKYDAPDFTVRVYRTEGSVMDLSGEVKDPFNNIMNDPGDDFDEPTI